MYVRCPPSLAALCGLLLAVVLTVSDATATDDDSMVLAADYASAAELTPEELLLFGELYGQQSLTKRGMASRAIPFSGGMYGKRASMIPFSGGMYGKRRGAIPFSGGIYGKRATVPFSGGMYGKRASMIPFSGGMYGKRGASKFHHSIKSRAIPMSGGLYG